jgi:lysophospholipase L1-like esterase
MNSHTSLNSRMSPWPTFTLRLTSLWLATVFVLAHSALDPRPRPESGWQDRHRLLNERAADAGKSAEIIFIGDSITQGWEGAGKEAWAQYYAPRNALNLGIGGDRTQHVLWRLQNGNLEGLNPKAAVVMIGTNNSNGEDNSVSQIADGIAAIIRELQTRLPDTKILLVAIFPRSENPTPQRGKVLSVNQVIRNLADDSQVLWVDFGHKFVDPQGLIPTELMPDYLHLSPKGYELWAKSLEPTLNAILEHQTTAEAQHPLAGDWIWTINGPDGQPISAPLKISVDGNRVSAQFARDASRWLASENGRLDGNSFSWTVRRNRPDGGAMVYQMQGRLENGAITATASTTVDGQEQTSPWTARRP